MIEQALARVALDSAVTRLEPRDNRLQLTLEAARMSALLRWLALIHDELRRGVESMRLTPESQTGLVSGQIVLNGVRL